MARILFLSLFVGLFSVNQLETKGRTALAQSFVASYMFALEANT